MIQVSYGDLPVTDAQIETLCWERFHVRCSGDWVLVYKYNTCWCTSPPSTTKPTPTPPLITVHPTTPPPTTPTCPHQYEYNTITGLCDCPFGKVFNWKLNRCVCPRGHLQRYNYRRRQWECVCPSAYHRVLGWHLYKCCLPGQVLNDGGRCVCPEKECPSGYVSKGYLGTRTSALNHNNMLSYYLPDLSIMF